MSRQQLWRWAGGILADFSAGLSQGCGGPAISLAIQAQLPAHRPGPVQAWQGAQAAADHGHARARRLAPQTGVQA